MREWWLASCEHENGRASYGNPLTGRPDSASGGTYGRVLIKKRRKRWLTTSSSACWQYMLRLQCAILRCSSSVILSGRYLGFGVCKGKGINCIVSSAVQSVHGLVSFKGLPTDLDCRRHLRRAFDKAENLPPIEDNVVLRGLV